MAGGYTVGIASETKAFRQGIESGVIDPLEDAQKELLELGKSRGPEQLERAMKDAERATERLGDETKDTARAIEQEFRDAYRKVKRSADDALDGGSKSFGKMSEGAQEVTQEIGQNLGEAVSSVRGNLADLGQVGQDTLGGLAATLAGSGGAGILGAAGLAAGAVGLGLVTAELQKQQEAADEFRRRISAAYQGAAEDGRNFIDTQQVIADGLDLIFNPDRAEEYKKAVADANQLGLDLSTIISASNGDLEAQKTVQQEINQLLDSSNSYELTGTTNKKTLKNDVAELRDRWEEVVSTTSEYADKTRVANEVTSTMLFNLIESAGTAQEEVDAVGTRLLTLPSGEQIIIDAVTGQAHQNIDAFKGDLDGVPETVTTTAVVQAALGQAQRDINNFIASNDGKSFKINGRVVTSGADWD